MTDERSLTRRTSLKGIAGTGALLLGAGLGSNTVSAAEGSVPGVEEVLFEGCQSAAIKFEESFVAPADDGFLTLPIEPVGDDALFVPVESITDDAITIPSVGGTDTSLALPYTSLSSNELVLPAVDDSGLVELSHDAAIPILETKDDGIVIPTDGTSAGYHLVPLEGGGTLKLPTKRTDDDAVTIDLANGSAVFPIEGSDADGAAVVAPVVRELDGYVTTVRVRTYNAAENRVETVVRELTVDDLRTTTLTGGTDYGDVIAWTFNAYQFYDRPLGAGDHVLSVTINGQTVENPNDCGGPTEKTGHGGIDLEDVFLVPTCVDAETGVARYAVDNENPKPVELRYAVEETERVDTITVGARSTTYLDVLAPDGEATLALVDDDDEVLVAAESNDEVECLPRNRTRFNFQCVRRFEATAEFYVHNGTDEDRTYTYYVAETGETGVITVEDTVASAETFTVSAPEGQATVGLYYEGALLDADVSDPDEIC